MKANVKRIETAQEKEVPVFVAKKKPASNSLGYVPRKDYSKDAILQGKTEAEVRYQKNHKPRTPQNPLDLDATNANRFKHNILQKTNVRGPIHVSPNRKYVYSTDRFLKDNPIARTPEGKRIFAYNDNGTPICYAKKAGQNGARCQSIQTMFNGRCRIHGGKSPKGAEHWRSQALRGSDTLPKHLQADMRRADDDSDLVSSEHELKLLDIQIAQGKRNLDVGLNEDAQKRLANLIISLEKKLEEDEGVDEDFLQEIVKTFKSGIDEVAAWDRINKVITLRDKVTATQGRREKDLKLMLRADQAMALTNSLAAAAISLISRFVEKIEQRFILIDRTKIKIEQAKQIAAIMGTNLDDRVPVSMVNDFRAGIAAKLDEPTSGVGETPLDENIVDAEFTVK